MNEVEIDGDKSARSGSGRSKGRTGLKNFYLTEDQGDRDIDAIDVRTRPDATADHFSDTTVMSVL